MTKLKNVIEITIAAGLIAIASVAVIGSCLALYPFRLWVEKERCQ